VVDLSLANRKPLDVGFPVQDRMLAGATVETLNPLTENDVPRPKHSPVAILLKSIVPVIAFAVPNSKEIMQSKVNSKLGKRQLMRFSFCVLGWKVVHFHRDLSS
jgi:hypothetical protein